MDQTIKTKIIELLDSKKIQYRLINYNSPVYTCEEVVKQENTSLDKVIKCIFLVDKNKNYFLVCTTADKRIDLPKIKNLMNCSRLRFAFKEEIEKVLEQEIGTVSPLLFDKRIPIIFDNKIMKKEKISISSGDPNAGIELNPRDIVPLVKPKFANITR